MIKIFRNVFPSHGGDRKTSEEQPFIKESQALEYRTEFFLQKKA